MSITFWHPAGPESLNLSNINASALLTYLGLPAGPAGDLDAQDLIVRCATIRHTGHGLDALGQPDPGHPIDDGGLSRLDVDLGGPRLIDCGRRPGYLAERLAALEQIAVDALVSEQQSVRYA